MPFPQSQTDRKSSSMIGSQRSGSSQSKLIALQCTSQYVGLPRFITVYKHILHVFDQKSFLRRYWLLSFDAFTGSMQTSKADSSLSFSQSAPGGYQGSYQSQSVLSNSTGLSNSSGLRGDVSSLSRDPSVLSSMDATGLSVSSLSNSSGLTNSTGMSTASGLVNSSGLSNSRDPSSLTGAPGLSNSSGLSNTGNLQSSGLSNSTGLSNSSGMGSTAFNTTQQNYQSQYQSGSSQYQASQNQYQSGQGYNSSSSQYQNQYHQNYGQSGSSFPNQNSYGSGSSYNSQSSQNSLYQSSVPTTYSNQNSASQNAQNSLYHQSSPSSYQQNSQSYHRDSQAPGAYSANVSQSNSSSYQRDSSQSGLSTTVSQSQTGYSSQTYGSSQHQNSLPSNLQSSPLNPNKLGDSLSKMSVKDSSMDTRQSPQVRSGVKGSWWIYYKCTLYAFKHILIDLHLVVCGKKHCKIVVEENWMLKYSGYVHIKSLQICCNISQ